MITKICEILEKFKTENKSIYELLKETDYYENHPLVTIESIEKYLQKNSNIIESWIEYSENKRTSDGWYIIKTGKNTIVGHLNNDKNEKVKEFTSPTNACAFFILNEINSINSL